MAPSSKKRSHSPIQSSEVMNEQDVDELGASQQSPKQHAQQTEHPNERATTGHKRRSRRHRSRSRSQRADMDYAQDSDRMNVETYDEQAATENATNDEENTESTSSLSNTELADLFTMKSLQVVTAFNECSALKQTIRDTVQSLYDMASSSNLADQTKAQTLQVLLDKQRKRNETLEQDLADLRLRVATFSRMPGQVSDTELKEQMEDIWQQACHWTRSNFRKLTKVASDGQDIAELSETSKMLLGDYLHILPGSSHAKVLKLGRMIVAFEVTKILSDFYFGIDEDGSFGGIIRLADAAKAGDADYEEWRARTAERLNNVDSSELREAISVKAVVIRTDLDLLFRELFGAPENDDRMRHLAEIIDKSIKLGQLCAAQRTRYRFGMPKMEVQNGIRFDPGNMDNVAGPDPSDLSKKVVRFALFPWLVKYDDDLSTKTCFIPISKAKVVCEVE